MTKPAEFRQDSDGSSGLPDSGILNDVPLSVEESLDSDDLGDTDAGVDPLDDSWDPPDRPSRETRRRITANEQRLGASLDSHLAQEVPDVDPYLEAERTETGLVLEDDVAGPVPADPDAPGRADTGDPPPRLGGLVVDEDGSDEGRQLVARGVDAPGNPTTWPAPAEDDALHFAEEP